MEIVLYESGCLQFRGKQKFYGKDLKCNFMLFVMQFAIDLQILYEIKIGCIFLFTKFYLKESVKKQKKYNVLK
jgi:hypothetical protein